MDSNLTAENASNGSATRRRLLGIAQVLVSLLLLGWLLNRVGVREVIRQFAGMNVWWFVGALVLFLLSIVVRAVRWKMMLTPLDASASLWTLTKLYLFGIFWNSFLPTGFGGDVAKGIALARQSKLPAEAATSVIAERVIGLLGTSLLAVIVLLVWPRLVDPQLFLIILLICAAIIAGGWFIRLDLLTWLDVHVPFLRRIVRNRRIVALHSLFRRYEMRTLFLAMLISIPVTLSLIVVNYMIALSLDVRVAPHYFAIFTPVVSVANLLPLSFNGLGVREYLYQLLFVPVGVNDEQSVAMALAFNMTLIISGLIGGAVWLATSLQEAVNPTAAATSDSDSSV